MNNYDWERCQAYLRHMEGQHRRLNDQLRRIRELLEAGTSAGTEPRQARLNAQRELEALREELLHHFHEEDDGGCLEEAVSHCPTLAHEVRIIEAQHRDLLGQLDQMIVRQRAGESTRDDFQRFMQSIDQHEALEDHVVQHGFNVAVDV
jgi:outer membrane protein TolC